MTLVDLLSGHYRVPQPGRDVVHGEHRVGCICGWLSEPIIGKGYRTHAAHLQDAILAAFPAIADALPEADCSICGEWLDRDHLTPTIPDGWVCGRCIDELPRSLS